MWLSPCSTSGCAGLSPCSNSGRAVLSPCSTCFALSCGLALTAVPVQVRSVCCMGRAALAVAACACSRSVLCVACAGVRAWAGRCVCACSHSLLRGAYGVRGQAGARAVPSQVSGSCSCTNNWYRCEQNKRGKPGAAGENCPKLLCLPGPTRASAGATVSCLARVGQACLLLSVRPT